MAGQLVDSLATSFKPERYHDDYRDCLVAMLERKAQGEEIVTQPAVDHTPMKAGDLMAALEASLADAKAQSKGGGKSNGRSHAHGRRRKSA